MSQGSPTFGKRGAKKEKPRSLGPAAATSAGAPPGWLTKVILIVIPAAIMVGGIMVFLFQFVFEARDELDAFLKPMFTHVIAASWTEESIEGYSTRELNAWFSSNDSNAVFAPWRALGPMVSYEGVSGFQVNTQGTSGSAEATVTIEFEQGVMTFNVTLRRIEGRWYLHGLRSNE